MPVWIVEYFGEARLDILFWIITGSTAPFWLLMIVFGQVRWVRTFCNPWLIPPLLCGLYLYCLYLMFTVTRVPEVPIASLKGAREFWFHPFLFLSLWTHRMIFDLFCGMMLNRLKEAEGGFGKLSLFLIWILGPIGLILFAIRYWLDIRGRLTDRR